MKRNIKPFVIVCIIFLLASLSYSFGIFDTWENKIIDRFFLKSMPKENVIILAIDDQSLAAIGGWPWKRRIFADILTRLQGAKAIGFDINFADPASNHDDDLLFLDALKNSKVPVVFPLELREDSTISVKPLEIFIPYVSVGFVNMPVDSDGTVRNTAHSISDFNSFASVVAGTSSSALGARRIHYFGPQKTFTTIPFIDVYEGKIPARIFDGATVFIGATAHDLHDFLPTPFGIMSGVEVNANSFETLKENKLLKDVPAAAGLALILVFNLLAALSIIRIRRFSLLALALVSLLLFIILASFSAFYFLIIFPVLYVLIGFIITSIVMLSFQYMLESKEKRFIRKTFQYYLSADVIEELVGHPEKLQLGGEMRTVSILFSDVRGFTNISEAMTPKQLTAFMCEYFTGTSDILMEKRGVIDKYIGDAIMAFWGAPLHNPHHAEDACMAAMGMLQRLKEDNITREARGEPPIAIGVGINTGDVVVGNMGSLKRFNYTIIGDDVNFTSRLEGLTKQYGISCIISETTNALIKGAKGLYTRELDDVIVKGKKKPKKIFELMTTPEDPSKIQSLEDFRNGRELYVKGKWQDAIILFDKAIRENNDAPSKVFLNRCEELLVHPPAAWDGVYEFKTK